MELSCLVIPPVNCVCEPLGNLRRQKNQQVSTTIIADCQPISWEIWPLAGRGRLPKDVIASPRKPLAIRCIQDRVQPEHILTDCNLTTVVAANAGDVTVRQRAPELDLCFPNELDVEGECHGFTPLPICS